MLLSHRRCRDDLVLDSLERGGDLRLAHSPQLLRAANPDALEQGLDPRVALDLPRGKRSKR